MPVPGGDEASGAMPVSLVCCGLIGTMVTDGGMVDRAYAEAIGTQGVVTGTAAYARCMAQVHQRRGEPAADVLQAVFPDSQDDTTGQQQMLCLILCNILYWKTLCLQISFSIYIIGTLLVAAMLIYYYL